ncbi:MAG: RICIN domain-containing protein, partial [Clostridia bacterium]|nr:RICIN domain-containing protein [Clostridia bacterium]
VGIGENFVPYVGQDEEGDIWAIEEVSDREGMERYTITADGKYLTGTPFGFVDAEDGDNTTWMLMSAKDDAFTIINMGTGKAIDISGGNTAAGAKLISYDLSKNDNQLFFMEEVEGGFNLKMKHSELYLTVNEDGTITQEEKSADKVQTFVFDILE